MKSTFSQQDIVQRNPDLLSSQIDGEIIMMNMHDGNYYGLNEIASRIWELIEKPIVYSDLIKALLAEFDVTEEACSNDVSTFLAQLAEKKLIVIESKNV